MKKKYVLKRWVKVVLNVLGIVAFMFMCYLAFRITPEQEEALNKCINQGYSRIECEKGLFGY